jgi:hypothetical protein
MELDEESRRQIVLSLLAVGFFIVLMVAIGAINGGAALTANGALMLIGAIALFVLVMGGIGVFLARRE